MEHLISHFKPQAIKIAEWFKFFKRHQLGGESTTEFMTKLRRLEKTCNFGDYLESAIRDQFVCGLRDTKTQQELLCVLELTVKTALSKARAAETVYKETRAMKESSCSEAMFNITAKTCYCCWNADHVAANCRFKTVKCNMCQKIGHLARMCKAKPKRKWEIRGDTKQSKADAMKEKEEVYTLDTEAHSSGSESDHLYAILQLGNKSDKFLASTKINGVDIEMELDSRANRSTIPWVLFQEKLAGACELVPTDLTLYQYDKSPLMIKGQCKVTGQALVKKQLGPLTYEVEVAGQVCSAHVDHLKPWPVESLPSTMPLPGDIPSDIPLENPQSDNNNDSMTASFLVPVTDEESDEQTHSTSRPRRSRRPPHRLIEEMT